MTKEELLKLPHEELAEKALSLENERDAFYDMYNKTKETLELVKNIIKSVIVLTD